MFARLSAFTIWALVAATAVFWGLRLLVRAPATPTHAVVVANAASVRGDLGRLLGTVAADAPAAVVTPEAASRFRLIGIVAPKSPVRASAANYGFALIAVDGKLPKAYPVGAALDDDLVLQSVSLRSVSIGAAQGKSAITLELPPLAAAATGTLAAGVSSDNGVVVPRPMGFVPPIPRPVLPRYVPPVAPQLQPQPQPQPQPGQFVPPQMPGSPIAPAPPNESGNPTL
ncbi:MAG: hypothetical protein ABIQ60_09210 [Burkholderiaceae bacterium]